MEYRFEWDEVKARSNLAKHGIAFEKAIEVFADVFSIEYENAGNDCEEVRVLIIGRDMSGRLLAAVYTDRDRRRIISARKATANERRDYHRQNSKE